ncbi:M1 family metallopeptidase [Psychroflexus sp. YR1-1]|uniref:M1 family metallopeptidase n=1 Tax=Psychroflexus aurantiacus TaxID=2709310 RepID=A0A6B3R3U0_9FLAO|nr:M1 family metallopeptidase [Psychroflexus aurantiacus]NEV94230.1 M1 family metallopeptidase [Psychroflexus aurantiacus]
MIQKSLYLALLLISFLGFSQNKISADILTSDDLKTLNITQKITFENTSDKPLNSIYLYDWNNAFSDKESPLAKRYAQEYVRRFHFASDDERGGTQIHALSTPFSNSSWKRVEGQPDLIEIELEKALPPGQSVDIDLNYSLYVPDSNFTGFGWNQRELILNQWLISPAILQEEWILYSHKDLNDYPLQRLDYDLTFEFPNSYRVKSSFEHSKSESSLTGYKKLKLTGKNLAGTKLYVKQIDDFEAVKTDHVTLITNLKDSELRPEIEALILDRIVYFLENRFGDFDFETMMITEEDYNTSPVYGLNQLPSFIRPFPDGFQYDIKVLKTLTDQYLRRSLLTHTRKNQWFLDAILVKVMIDYVETYYPDVHLLGSFSDFIGIKWFHASDLMFNDRYNFIHQTTIRQNLGQPVDFPQDSLLKFNQKLSNPYKGGLGFKYLEDYLGKDIVDESLKIYFNKYNSDFSSPQDYFDILSVLTDKDISWFYNNYLGSSKDIDFKIKRLRKIADSLEIKLINKTRNAMPVPVYQLKGDKILSKNWVEPFKKDTLIYLEDLGSDQIALNYEQVIPEINIRNNFKSRGKLLNKPFQFRLLEDIEDPAYNQLFITPEFTYNLYDGLALGPKLYNTSVLPKQLSFKINPKYGLKSNAVVGGASIDYTHFLKGEDLFQVRYGLTGSRFSYNEDLFYRRYSGYVGMTYRPQDLRDNARHNLFVRTVNVDQDINELVETEEPNYNIFNIRYNFTDKSLDKSFTSTVDYQIAQKFSKISTTFGFRKLYNNNRQINLRFYGGLFLYNDEQDSNFFSFALDRPTDYLFDYNYYGRSEESGLFSQQFIMAEGGFKSQFDQRFADNWIASTNVSTTLWNWIFVYGDAGFFKNSYSNPQFVYDSGIRLSFVEDYFELYLPIYSSKGWEIGQDNYDQRIRFIVSLDLSTIFKLFTRKWY